MKRSSTLFLKFVLILIGSLILTFLLWFPHLEGRAKNLDFLSIYLDPVIGYVYFTSIPFFVALYQAFKLLGYIEQNNVFSQIAVKALRNIKYCATVIAVLISIGMPWVAHAAQQDDAPGLVLIVFAFIFVSGVVATAAAVFESLLQKAVDLKSENDLTV